MESQVYLIVLCLVCTVVCVPPKTKTPPPISPVLAGDQSLPVHDVLPVDVAPGGVPPSMSSPDMIASQLFPTDILQKSTGIVDMGPMPGNIQQGQPPPPVPMLPPTGQPTSLPAQPFPNQVPPARTPYPAPNSPISMMNIVPMGTWMPPIPAPMVLMNLQMACRSLQQFVLGTPMAREIMQSVTNMYRMAADSAQSSQCGYPSLSASLRMFLSVCNRYTSCAMPMQMPFQSPIPAMPPIVPYMVPQPVLNPGQQAQMPTTQQPKQPVTGPVVSRVMRKIPQSMNVPPQSMFQNLPNNFKFSRAGGQTGRQSMGPTTPEPSGVHDD